MQIMGAVKRIADDTVCLYAARSMYTSSLIVAMFLFLRAHTHKQAQDGIIIIIAAGAAPADESTYATR